MSTQDVIDRFLDQVQRQPEHPAIVMPRETASYGDLHQRVMSFASHFSTRDAKVVIALPPSVDAYSCMLAAAFSGGFYTPLNLSSPPAKLARIISLLQPDFIVGSAETLMSLDTGNARVIDPKAVDYAGPVERAGKRSQLAYVLFTSGSTGDPKGVMVPRDALANYVDWLATFQISSRDRVSQHPSLSFDISMTDIYGALCYGGTLFPCLDGDRLMPARFIARHGITVWNSTPSVMSLMIQVKQATSFNLGSVRLFNFCGEPLLKEHLDAIFQAVPDTLVQNTYGPTETTISVTVLKAAKDDYSIHCASSVALGDPIPGMDIQLVGGLTPDEGEIVIIGPQLAEGYWNDPGKTEKVFRAVSESDGRRGYHTGDWAVRKDGDIFFKERIDFQVKIKGHRIELDEISQAIRNCGYPVNCVFKRGEGLAAVIEHAAIGEKPDMVLLRKDLFSKLESYCIPEEFRVVTRIPRNENDKLDRKAAAALFEQPEGSGLE